MDKSEQVLNNRKVDRGPGHRQNIPKCHKKSRGIAGVIRSSSGLAQIVVIIASIIVATAAVGGAGAYYLVNRTLSHPHEDTARLMPPDTSLYFSLNLRPGAGQLNKFRNVLSKFTDQPGFEGKFDDNIDKIQSEIGIDLKNDVFPWLGPELALSVTDITDIEELKVLVLVGTTDKDASRSVFDKWLDYREKSRNTPVNEDSYLDIDLYSIEPQHKWEKGEHYALTDDYIVFSTSIELVKDTIDKMKSPGDSLADEEDFQITRQSVQDERVAFLYMNVEEIYRQAQYPLGFPFNGSIIGQDDRIPVSGAMSASFREDGFQMDFVTNMIPGSKILSGSERIRSAEMLPSDTIAVFYLGNFKSLWEQATDTLKSQQYMFEMFEEAINELEHSSGYDLERDIFSWMEGEIAIALLPSRIAVGKHGGMEGAFEAVALIESSDLGATEDFLKDIEKELLESGLEFEQQVIKGHDVTLMPEDFLNDGYSLGYTILGDFLVIGITKDAIVTVIDIYDGNGASLAGDSVYRKIQDDLAGNTVSMFYVNMAGVKDMILGWLDPSEMATYNSDVAPFVEPLDRLIMDWSTTADENRQTIIVTIK